MLCKVSIVVATTDDLAAEHFDIVTVASEGLGSKPLLDQIEQERLKALGEAAGELDVGVFNCPQLRPSRQGGTQFIDRRRLGRDNRAFILSPTLAAHADHPPA